MTNPLEEKVSAAVVENLVVLGYLRGLVVRYSHDNPINYAGIQSAHRTYHAQVKQAVQPLAAKYNLIKCAVKEIEDAYSVVERYVKACEAMVKAQKEGKIGKKLRKDLEAFKKVTAEDLRTIVD